MYFDFDDRYTDIEPVGRAINLRDGIVVSVLFHVVAVAVLLLVPALLPQQDPNEILSLRPEQESPQFVFVQPRVDKPAPQSPNRADLSDLDRRSRSIERPPLPENQLPFARGNSPERVEAEPEERARGKGPAEQPAPEVPRPADIPSAARDESQTALMQKPAPQQPPPGGSLGDALRNLQRYVQKESFDNQKGNSQEFGPAIQFDTKGVEFGPWIRRFVAQVKRNWFIPYAAMTMRGHVVITFNVHRNGAITDVQVVKPSPIDSFNTAAVNALLASNPTEPLPPEYPDDRAFFTVTFFYNESPGGQ